MQTTSPKSDLANDPRRQKALEMAMTAHSAEEIEAAWKALCPQGHTTILF